MPKVMNRGLGGHPELYIKQTKKGWLMECCCPCEANNEFFLGTTKDKSGDLFYALEETSCCIRCICGSARPSTTKLYHGLDANGPHMLTFHRPFRCPAANCKCCCLQTMDVFDSNGTLLGTTQEQRCWLCVPGFFIKDSSGTKLYEMHQPTCCGGCCVNCCHPRGGSCCRVPFLLYAPDSAEEIGAVTKIWSGLGKELLTDAQTYVMEAPKLSEKDAANILGATFLINMNFFENTGGG